ncbi:hypothetical protein E4T49_06282 [Aureobasidium sp. EXF-10728]|nr:hypothetical protein E4T49_06282 [Aureobasidium sp. EXF-10728]
MANLRQEDSLAAMMFSSQTSKRDRVRAILVSEFPTYSMVRSLAFGQDDEDRRKCCLKTTEEIFTFIGTLSQHRDEYPTPAHLIDEWAVGLPSVFKDMLVERRPIALIILAYWAVLTSMNPRPWHVRGLAEVVIARIEIILGQEWAEFLRWPKERVMENARQIPERPVQTPHFNNRSVDNHLDDTHLSHQVPPNQTGSDVRTLQPSPYSLVDNQASPYASTHPSPHPPASDHLSPHNIGSNVHSPYSQGPTTD